MKKLAIFAALILAILSVIKAYDRYWPYPIRTFSISYDALNSLNQDIASTGKTELKKHKIIISGIARDNRRDLKRVISMIESTGSEFADYRVVIFENDSKDGTKGMLALWALLNNKVTILSHDFHNKKRPNIKFLADARNRYIEYINGKFNDFDMIMALDMDMSLGWDMRGIYSTFAQVAQWDAVCAHGMDGNSGIMSDAFAYRSEEFPYGPEHSNYWSEIVPKIQRIIDPSSPMIAVHSCFNGMAFYKRSQIAECYYDSVNNDCEHIAFHECIREKHDGKIFLNPAMVIKYPGKGG